MSASLSGGFSGTYAKDTGSISGALSLGSTSATFVVLGFLPVTAYISFSEVAPTTATLTGTTLSTLSKIKVSVPYVALFGLVPLGGGANCATTTPVSVALTSPGAFSVTQGGSLTGMYTIPPLSNCGGITDAVNGYVAGPGNTVKVALAP